MITSFYTHSGVTLYHHPCVCTQRGHQTPPTYSSMVRHSLTCYYTHLSYMPALISILFPLNLLSEQPVKVQPARIPIVSISFLVTKIRPGMVRLLYYLQDQQEVNHLNLSSPTGMTSFQPPLQLLLSQAIAQADTGTVSHPRGFSSLIGTTGCRPDLPDT